MLKILLAGGGTAGHVNPALAIAEIIKEKHSDAEFAFAGTPDGIEARLVPNAGYKFYPIKVKGFQRKLNFNNIKRNIKAASYLLTAGKNANKIIDDFKPDLVVGTGGYVSGPVVRAAAKRGIKTAIHEQNAYPGVTNKLLSKEVDKVMLTVKEACDYLEKDIDITVTGLPVRKSFAVSDKAEARKKLGIPEDAICILSTGGSLGARTINNSAKALFKWYQEENIDVYHIHSYGTYSGYKGYKDDLKAQGIDVDDKRFIISDYVDMSVCMAASDLVISRCGANTLNELESVGRGAILIPSPNVAGNHQYYNGLVLQNADAAIVIEEKDLTDEKIVSTVRDLISSRDRLATLSENARGLYIQDTNERIYSVLSELLKDVIIKR
ncbi:MAG: undecaprenyldiphospho-muramoylpentapeptide beta-N-acetylglucosaminyltransferase [Ruminococcus sp.]|nr:undecaprenyldiphospho-muramoylpentapeptide beta-N-acetylglucosaminyltransferase [Ruminococcus sp.]